jgi:hypothetical protein
MLPGISSSESLTKKAGTLAIPLAGFNEDDMLPWVLSMFILSPAPLPTAPYWTTQVLQLLFFFGGGGRGVLILRCVCIYMVEASYSQPDGGFFLQGNVSGLFPVAEDF